MCLEIFRLFRCAVGGIHIALKYRFGAGVVKVGDLWFTCNRYQCKDCGYISYGSKWHFPALNGKKPIGCK